MVVNCHLLCHIANHTDTKSSDKEFHEMFLSNSHAGRVLFVDIWVKYSVWTQGFLLSKQLNSCQTQQEQGFLDLNAAAAGWAGFSVNIFMESKGKVWQTAKKSKKRNIESTKEKARKMQQVLIIGGVNEKQVSCEDRENKQNKQIQMNQMQKGGCWGEA